MEYLEKNNMTFYCTTWLFILQLLLLLVFTISTRLMSIATFPICPTYRLTAAAAVAEVLHNAGFTKP